MEASRVRHLTRRREVQSHRTYFSVILTLRSVFCSCIAARRIQEYETDRHRYDEGKDGFFVPFGQLVGQLAARLQSWLQR